MSWTDNISNILTLDTAAGISCNLTDGKVGMNFQNVNIDNNNFDLSQYLNNTFNILNFQTTPYTPYKNFHFRAKGGDALIFLYQPEDTGMPEDPWGICLEEHNEIITLAQMAQFYPGFYKTWYFENYGAYGLSFLIIDLNKLPAATNVHLFFENCETEGSQNINFINSILVLSDYYSYFVNFPYNHEISSNRQANFNGTTFTAQSGAIKKYQLGKPEIIYNLNYKIENESDFEKFAKLQRQLASNGHTVILKEKDEYLFLSDTTLNANQVANLVWEININGKEKV